MKTLLITGANGFLGYRTAIRYKNKYHVVALTHHELDITNALSVMQTFDIVHPDFVIHCAAISNPSTAERHPELAQKVNVDGTVNIAHACLAHKAKLLFMSSDQVYNGTKQRGALTEGTPLAPTDVYGRNKMEAEKQVFELLPSAVALRLTWMYDAPDSDKVNTNILTLLLDAYKTKKPLLVSTNEYRGFTDVNSVVENFEKCFDIPGGAYNFGAENNDNCYNTFLKFARKMNLPNAEQWIHPNDSLPFCNISMNTQKISNFIDNFQSSLLFDV